MLPTFVIGIREGLEAALIVGIIAAFLRKQGRPDLLRWVAAGVGAAVLLCVAVGVGLEVASRELPQRQQEGLETVIGAVAVVTVTFMVVWMRRHSRGLKGQLETMAADSLGAGARAMVLMAFLAVVREGFETVVFLIAAFDQSTSGAAGGVGAVLGLLVAIALGVGIYRGGVRLDLSKFFRATGLVLVLVAAGLVVSTLHTAHEAGWLTVGQGRTVDLSALVRPGSVQASLLTGMLGIQPRPVVIEVVGWLVYLVPVALYVIWPPGRERASRRLQLGAALLASAGVAALVATVVASPGTPVERVVPANDRVATGHATITVTAADGCVPSAGRFRAGGISLHVINKDATAVTEVEVLSGSRIVGEKENVPPGFSGDFAVTLPAGAYTLFCPGATPERRSIVVTGERAPADDSPVTALLAQASSGYAAYVSQQVGQLVTAAERLAAAVRGTDLAAAQRAYAGARPYYERIEPVAESFSVGGDDIDADIDARAGDVPAAQWRGMHVLERGLFQARSLDGLAPVADRLVDDVRRLQRLTATQRYQPTELANGAQELLDEVVASKITGEEERYSRLDLLDMTDNVVGSQQAFAQLRPALQRIDPALTATIAQRFAALDRAIDAYRDPSALGGVVRYTALTADDKRALAAAVKSVQEPLSTVAQKVAAQS